MTDKHIRQLSLSEFLAKYETEFNAGDGSALLNAVRVCLECGCDAPKWLKRGFNVALIKYESGESWTLDEAFNVQRPKGRHRKRYRKDVLANIMWQEVKRLHTAGKKLTPPVGQIRRPLFESVAEELNARTGELYDGLKFNGTDVQEAYYAFENVTKKLKKPVTTA